jgi:hypothetical protein
MKMRRRQAKEDRCPQIREPFVEDLVDGWVFRDMHRAIREYLDERFGSDGDMIERVWDGPRRVGLQDPDGWKVAVISLSNDGIEIFQFATPWAVARKNDRLGFSCGIGERRESDQSPAGKMVAARTESGGTCSTN